MLTCQRHMFSLPKGLHYLNCASQSPLPNTVAQAAHEAIARKINPSLASDAESFAPVEALREIVGRVVNASAERVEHRAWRVLPRQGLVQLLVAVATAYHWRHVAVR